MAERGPSDEDENFISQSEKSVAAMDSLVSLGKQMTTDQIRNCCELLSIFFNAEESGVKFVNRLRSKGIVSVGNISRLTNATSKLGFTDLHQACTNHERNHQARVIRVKMKSNQRTELYPTDLIARKRKLAICRFIIDKYHALSILMRRGCIQLNIEVLPEWEDVLSKDVREHKFEKSLATVLIKQNLLDIPRPLSLSCTLVERRPHTENDIQLFIEELKAKYKKWYEAAQPLPYIRDTFKDTVFAEPGIQSLEPMSTKKKLGSYHLLFPKTNRISKRRILEGEAGHGKSTLTLQYAYDWCYGVHDSQLKEVEILIRLPLRQLEHRSIYRAIKQIILSPRSRLTESDIEGILRSTSSVVFILEGLDEYPYCEDKTDVMKIVLGEMFQNLEVVTTTRYLPSNFTGEVDRLRITGFDHNSRDVYIQKTFAGNHSIIASKIKEEIQNNPVVGDFFEIPFFFQMFAHMIHREKDFQTCKTVTSFFQYMMRCLHSHTRSKLRVTNFDKYHMFEEEHHYLDKLAFKLSGRTDQKLVLRKQELCKKLEMDFYDYYVQIGILVEETLHDNFGMRERTDGHDSRSSDNTEVKFYHKLFCEWYAAHHLVTLAKRRRIEDIMRNINPLDLQFCLRFACGLNSDAAVPIIEYVFKQHGNDNLAASCIYEQVGLVESVRRIVVNLCSKEIEFGKYDSNLQQKTTIHLLNIASNHKIPISRLYLRDCFCTVDVPNGRYLRLISGSCIPVLVCLRKLHIWEESKEVSPEEFSGIVRYIARSLQLKKVLFSVCLLPQSVRADSLSDLKSRNVEVLWGSGIRVYRLNNTTGIWQRTAGDGGGVMTDSDYDDVVHHFRNELRKRQNDSN